MMETPESQGRLDQASGEAEGNTVDSETNLSLNFNLKA